MKSDFLDYYFYYKYTTKICYNYNINILTLQYITIKPSWKKFEIFYKSDNFV